MANAKKLTNIIIKVLKNRGLSPTHAMISAKALINAELVGAHSHGLSRLKMYCDRIDKKVINPKPKIKIKKISSSISYVDANNSIGFVAADIAIKSLIKNTKKTLKKAISLGGSSLRDFSSSDGKKGEFQQYFYVYGRKGENCLNKNCNKKIIKTVIGNRATFYCPKCQK